MFFKKKNKPTSPPPTLLPKDGPAFPAASGQSLFAPGVNPAPSAIDFGFDLAPEAAQAETLPPAPELSSAPGEFSATVDFQQPSATFTPEAPASFGETDEAATFSFEKTIETIPVSHAEPSFSQAEENTWASNTSDASTFETSSVDASLPPSDDFNATDWTSPEASPESALPAEQALPPITSTDGFATYEESGFADVHIDAPSHDNTPSAPNAHETVVPFSDTAFESPSIPENALPDTAHSWQHETSFTETTNTPDTTSTNSGDFGEPLSPAQAWAMLEPSPTEPLEASTDYNLTPDDFAAGLEPFDPFTPTETPPPRPIFTPEGFEPVPLEELTADIIDETALQQNNSTFSATSHTVEFSESTFFTDETTNTPLADSGWPPTSGNEPLDWQHTTPANAWTFEETTQAAITEESAWSFESERPADSTMSAYSQAEITPSPQTLQNAFSENESIENFSSSTFETNTANTQSEFTTFYGIETSEIASGTSAHHHFSPTPLPESSFETASTFTPVESPASNQFVNTSPFSFGADDEDVFQFSTEDMDTTTNAPTPQGWDFGLPSQPENSEPQTPFSTEPLYPSPETAFSEPQAIPQISTEDVSLNPIDYPVANAAFSAFGELEPNAVESQPIAWPDTTTNQPESELSFSFDDSLKPIDSLSAMDAPQRFEFENPEHSVPPSIDSGAYQEPYYFQENPLAAGESEEKLWANLQSPHHIPGEQVPQNASHFLDSVNERLYPSDPFQSADGLDVLAGEQAFEEAAHYLFPETMEAPLEWDDSEPLPTTASMSDVYWPPGADLGNVVDLGPSFQSQSGSFNDLASFAEDNAETIAFEAPSLRASTADGLSPSSLGENVPPVAEVLPPPLEETPSSQPFETLTEPFGDFGHPMESPSIAFPPEEASAFAQPPSPVRDEAVEDEDPFAILNHLYPHSSEIHASSFWSETAEADTYQQTPSLSASGMTVEQTTLDQPAFAETSPQAAEDAALMPSRAMAAEAVSPSLLPPHLPMVAPGIETVSATPAKTRASTPSSQMGRLGHLDILSICVLSADKRLLIVHNEDVYALMAQVGLENPSVSVIKIFDHNPIAYQNTFVTVPERRTGQKGLYVTQVGTWRGMISCFQDRITLYTELG